MSLNLVRKINNYPGEQGVVEDELVNLIMFNIENAVNYPGFEDADPETLLRKVNEAMSNFNHYEMTGTPSDIILKNFSGISNFTEGTLIPFIASFSNVGDTTVTVNSAQPISIRKILPDGSSVPLNDGDIEKNSLNLLQYNNGVFNLIQVKGTGSSYIYTGPAVLDTNNEAELLSAMDEVNNKYLIYPVLIKLNASLYDFAGQEFNLTVKGSAESSLILEPDPAAKTIVNGLVINIENSSSVIVNNMTFADSVIKSNNSKLSFDSTSFKNLIPVIPVEVDNSILNYVGGYISSTNTPGFKITRSVANITNVPMDFQQGAEIAPIETGLPVIPQPPTGIISDWSKVEIDNVNMVNYLTGVNINNGSEVVITNSNITTVIGVESYDSIVRVGGSTSITSETGLMLSNTSATLGGIIIDTNGRYLSPSCIKLTNGSKLTVVDYAGGELTLLGGIKILAETGSICQIWSKISYDSAGTLFIASNSIIKNEVQLDLSLLQIPIIANASDNGFIDLGPIDLGSNTTSISVNTMGKVVATGLTSTTTPAFTSNVTSNTVTIDGIIYA